MVYFIQEGAMYSQPKVDYMNKDKAVFRTVLQSYDDFNRNKRRYPKKVLESALQKVKPRMKSRSFIGELDHPMVTGNASIDQMRQTVPLLSNACLLIRDYEFGNGNLVYGECETLSTQSGKNLLALLKDKVGLGMSLRGMAELNRVTEGFEVTDPLVIISYDSVSNPSHTSAKIQEVTFESTDIRNTKLTQIQENDKSNLICTSDGKCYIAEYFDRLIEQGIIKLRKNWF